MIHLPISRELSLLQMEYYVALRYLRTSLRQMSMRAPVIRPTWTFKLRIKPNLIYYKIVIKNS